MLIDELPRLTDDERDAIDGGYIAMEGVPAAEPIRKPRVPCLAKLIIAIGAFVLSACATRPAMFVEAGAGYMRDNPADAGMRDIRNVENPRGTLAAGVIAPLSHQVEFSVTVRHESGALVYDYGSTGIYAAVRWYLFRR